VVSIAICRGIPQVGTAHRPCLAKASNQTCTVINLISENTIEHRMLETLALKQSLAASVLDDRVK